MPMIDMQRRHAEVFRVRLGDKDAKRPRALTDKLRITARSSEVVQAFADVYGGEVSEWDGQWQVYLPTTELRVLVLPGESIQQWWEFYRGSVCERRCDGYQEQKSGKQCLCPEDIYQRADDTKSCSPMTRINVLCPDVAVVGAGSLVTHGMIAAQTLPQAVSVAEVALNRGQMVPAILRVVTNDSGRNHFVYPQLEIVGVSMNQLAASGGTPVSELATGTDGAAPAAPLTPVPSELPTGPGQSIAEQAAPPPPKPKRANAAPEIPASGRKRSGKAPEPEIQPGDDPDQLSIDQASDEPATESINGDQMRKLQTQLSQLEINERDQRLSICSTLVQRPLESSKDLTKTEASGLIDLLERLLSRDEPQKALDLVLAEMESGSEQ